MLVAGLTGGIGAGKTTFAALLAERGAHVIDADALARDALRPGQPSWHSIVDQFGDEILAAGSMDIDRKRLARVVFDDRDKLAALNAIVHPVVFRGMADTLDRLRPTDAIVVLDAALIIETGLDRSLDMLIVVVSERRERTERLVRERAMTPDEVNARIEAQSDPSELVARADLVVTNSGTLEDLAAEADRVWAELEARKK